MTTPDRSDARGARARVVDALAPAVVLPPVAPVPARSPDGVPPGDAEQTRREIEADQRSERRLVVWELLALAAVLLVVVVRALWLA